MTPAGSATLAYGRRVPHRRRLRWAALSAAVLTGAGVGHHERGRWLPPLRQRWAAFQLDRSQARCLVFSPPPGRVAFTDKADVPLGPDDRRVTSWYDAAVVWLPPIWVDYFDRVRAVDKATARVSSLSGPSAASGVALLHECRLPNGDPVLASITVEANGGQRDLTGLWWLPGTTTNSPRLIGVSYLAIDKADDADRFTLFAATPNPQDRTRFDLPYQMGSRAGVIHGRVSRSGFTFDLDTGWWDGGWVVPGAGLRLHPPLAPALKLAVPPPSRELFQLAYNADGRRLLGVFEEPPGVVSWDVAQRRSRTDVAIGDVPVSYSTEFKSLLLTGDGRLCVTLPTTADDGWVNDPTLRGFDPATGRLVGSIGLPGAGSCTLLACSPDGRSAYCGVGDRLFAVDTVRWRVQASTPLTEPAVAAASSDRRVAVAVGKLKNYPDRIVTFAAGTLASVGKPLPPFAEFAFEPSGDRLFAYSDVIGGPFGRPEGLYRLDVDAGVVTTVQVGGPRGRHHPIHFGPGAFSPDGRWWVYSDGAYTYLSTFPSLSGIWRVPSNSPRSAPAAFSPDGRSLAVETPNGDVAVWPVPRYPSPP